MTIRIWLNPYGVEAMTSNNKYGGHDKVSFQLRHLDVVCDPDNLGWYVVTDEVPFDPTAVMPNIPSQYIDHVTLRDYIFEGFRLEGVYRNDGMTALVRYEVGKPDKDGVCDLRQLISISGPTLAAVSNIYIAIRAGDLMPAQSWSQDVLEFAEAGEETAETTDVVRH